ncbi:MAG: AmmeMemoRadiSam system protein B [Deltaproteobacteria bacterium]|nr:AmmeMemoRadiSam system protein B [Deltaproteobacteria bacterium]
MDDERLPRLRDDIQLLPAVVQSRQLIAVQDRQGLSEGLSLLVPEAAALLPLFDGQHTVRDLQMALMRTQRNLFVPREAAEQVVRDLDELLLLQSERYRSRLAEAKAAYAQLDERPASHAGEAYPADPAGLSAFLDDLLGGPGLDAQAEARPLPAAVIAPHIDLRNGAQVYAAAYGRLRGAAAPERVVVLGTGHMLEHGLSVSTKAYRSPLGASPIDSRAAERLREAAGELLAPDDFDHRQEHSVEFELLFLQHLLGVELPVVAVLVGSLHAHLVSAERPAEIPGLPRFARELGALAAEGSLVVAGVDLSHVGPKFGHDEMARDLQAAFEAHDRALLDAVCAGSADALWAEARRVGDRYHVCGLPVLALLAEALPGVRGELAAYEVWHETPTRSAVSFAAVHIGQLEDA